MSQTAVGGPEIDTRREALAQVLHSQTFSRAEQLRKFLRYVTELELEGRSAEVSEYSIGVEALGRAASFTPSEDAIVRNRAHALRHKLTEYYSKENPAASLRIDLPKGAYIPRFVDAEVASHPEVAPAPLEPSRPVPVTPRRSYALALAASAGAGIASLIALLLWSFSTPTAPRVDPVIREAWGPLLTPSADVMLVMGVPTHFMVRPFPHGVTPPGERVILAPPPEAAEEYKRFTALPEQDRLVMQPSLALRPGEVLAMMAVTKILSAVNAGYRVLQDRTVSLASMRGENVFLAGDPQLSPILAQYLQAGVFSVEYDRTSARYVIRERNSSTPVAETTGPAIQRATTSLGEYPGLLTVLPSEPSNTGKKTVALACANSAGCQAAAEFFASPEHMARLRESFRKEGIHGFPRAYQVVVSARAENQSLLGLRYQTHRVLDRTVPKGH